MKRIYEEFGQKLRKARTNAQLSQESLARRVGLSRTSITNIESGNQAVQLHLLYALSRAIGVSPESLLPDVEEDKGEVPLAPKLLKGLNRPEQDWARRVLQKGKS